MSLLDTLLKTKAEKANEAETSVYYSKRLQKLTDAPEPVAITIKELSYNKVNELVARQFDKKGNYDFMRSARSKALLAVEGIVDPDLKDKKLIEHFGCETPADLAQKLFNMELTEISDEICRLSGLETDTEEAEEEHEEIKN